MELHTIVKAFTGQFLDPLNVAGGQIGAQLDHHIAGIERKNEIFVSHWSQSLLSCGRI